MTSEYNYAEVIAKRVISQIKYDTYGNCLIDVPELAYSEIPHDVNQKWPFILPNKNVELINQVKMEISKLTNEKFTIASYHTKNPFDHHRMLFSIEHWNTVWTK